MSTCLKDPTNTYRRFVEFEQRAATIYLQFASLFSENHQLSTFWLEMGMQEKEHASLLQFCSAEHLFVSDLPDTKEIWKLAALFEALEKRVADPELRLEEVFAIAMKLETSELNGIYQHLTTALHRSDYLLRRKIATGLMDHVDQVIQAAARFGLKNGAMAELMSLKESSSDHWKALKHLQATA